jgi:alkylhydroperoxidase family enzyme
VPDDVFDALNAYFSDAEIIELVALVGIMELASALGAVFQLTPD